MTGRLHGRRALVTGAAGGIGYAITARLAADGAELVVSDLDTEALNKRYADASFDTHHLCGNLANADFCETLAQNAADYLGGLDIVVNNAGIIRRGNILNASDADWHDSMAVNVEAVFRICRNAIGLMSVNGTGGAIINIASCWGLYPGPDHVIYCTTKAAVAALTKCLARDHAKDGIRVNAVCPNEVNTPMLRSGFAARGLDADSAIAQLNESVPLGRIAEPEDIADVVAFAVSDDARYLCGACIELNGAKPVFKKGKL